MVAPRHQVKKQPAPIALDEHPSAGVAQRMAEFCRERPPRIERRRVMRTSYRTQAWLQPADETGAVRPPLIHTRDLDASGLGFIATQDLSALGSAILHLPATNGRPVRIACRVRRSREFDLGWFEGLVEFVEPQPMLASRRM